MKKFFCEKKSTKAAKRNSRMRYPTYMKYFLSYLIIVTIMILGFFFIIRSQVTGRYFEQRKQQAKTQLDNIAGQINDDFLYLSQVDSSLMENINLLLSSYKQESVYRYHTHQELTQYADTTKLISSIIYMSKRSNDVVSTKYHVTYREGIFYITDLNPEQSILAFDPAPYLDAASGQMAWLTDENTQFLFYFPPISSGVNYLFFYLIDTTEIQLMLKSHISDDLPAIALVDENKQFVVDVNSAQLMPYLDSLELTDGIYELDSSTSICVHTGIGNGFAMIALISNNLLSQQINESFANTYLILLLLSAVGFLLILLAMRVTYLPLHRLTQKIVSDSDSGRSYLEQLDHAFSRLEERNQVLKNKLDNYRLAMQKSLLDSALPKQPGETALFLNIDQFFDAEYNSKIFVVQIAYAGRQSSAQQSSTGQTAGEQLSARQSFPGDQIRNYLQKALPGTDSCLILEARSESVTFLINFIGPERNKGDVLKALLNNLNEQYGYLSVISTGTNSPLDIPALYESVSHASTYWPQIPVADLALLPPVSAGFAYPYDKLELLSELLKENQFAAAGELINSLFLIIDQSNLTGNKLPDFYIRCILVDMLTVIINSIIQFDIDFKTCSDLYYETLYFCRSCPYEEKAQEILTNIGMLLSFYEEAIAAKINPALIRPIMEESYCQPDFSITVMADKFQVSITYMSYLIKKELGQNFTDYLWMLRFEKAKELLKSTDMPIEEISIAVGYFNSSSFRRKFKQETGLTPSQFRAEPQ